MLTLAQIGKIINAKIISNPQVKISGIASLSAANSHQLSYASNQYKTQLSASKAGGIIIPKNLIEYCPTNALVVDDVYLAFAKISHHFKKLPSLQQGIHKSAQLNNAKISAGVMIGKGVVLGKNCIIGANTVIEDDVMIGDNAFLQPNITILSGCSIGNNVVIGAGVVIGSEGFGNALDKQKHWHHIAHLGSVIIGNNVSIGANTVIDRGTLQNTQIDNGTCIDNLVHIAHNVIIKQNCAIAAAVVIGGSCILNQRCQIGGGVTIASHINIAADVVITGASTVDKNITESGHYTGFTSISKHQHWKKIQFLLLKFDKIVRYLNLKLKDFKDLK